MPYVPNAADPTQPTEDKTVESAALEFRTLKTKVAEGLLLPGSAERAGKILGFDASGFPVAIALGDNLDSSLRADLASTDDGKGGDLVGFIQDAIDAVARTYAEKLRESVTVEDFMSAADRATNAASPGSVDVLYAFQAAVNTGKVVKTESPTYLISGAINFTVARTIYQGGFSTIYQSVSSAKIFNVTAVGVKLQDFILDYVSTPTSGGTAIYAGGAEGYFERFKVNKAHKVMEIVGVNCHVSTFDAYNYVYAGIHLRGTGGCNIKVFKLDAITATNASQGGILMEDFVEGCTVSKGDILNGVYSLLTKAAAYGAGTRPAYNRFTAVFFDSAAQGSYIDKAVELTFTACWFSGGRSGIGYSGCTLGETDSITFSVTTFANCGAHGAHTSANAVRTTYSGCKALGNSVTTGPGVSHGFYFAPNTNSFTVNVCTAANVLFVGVQGYGVYVADGTSNSYNITENTLEGNSTGAIYDGGTGGTKYITSNLGYRTSYRGSGTVASGASTVSVPHYLGATPAISDIVLTTQYKKSFFGITDFWVAAVSSTTITVETDVATTNAFTFTFDVRIKGA